jgi:hypothetical protein
MKNRVRYWRWAARGEFFGYLSFMSVIAHKPNHFTMMQKNTTLVAIVISGGGHRFGTDSSPVGKILL